MEDVSECKNVCGCKIFRIFQRMLLCDDRMKIGCSNMSSYSIHYILLLMFLNLHDKYILYMYSVVQNQIVSWSL